MKSEELPKERTNGDRPAYATNGRMHKDAMGLTKREAFAMAAMQGLLSNSGYTGDNAMGAKTIAVWAIEQADELLKALENGSK